MTPQASFQAAVLDQLRHSPLDPAAQDALLQALSSAPEPAQAGRFSEEDPLAEWLGGSPANAAQIEFEALRRSFALRRQLLASTIDSMPAPCWGSLIRGSGASPSGSWSPRALTV
jgi:hypothetical protein